jgi:hypothetical protein
MALSFAGCAAHIPAMANPYLQASASCSPYTATADDVPPEPPELGYKFFSPEFLDELEEHHRSLAVGRLPA